MNKISSSMPVTGAQSGKSHARDSSHSVGHSGHSPAAPQDEMTLTAEARQLARAREAQQTLPDMDMERIEKLRAAIESNTYQVSPERIARKLVEMERM